MSEGVSKACIASKTKLKVTSSARLLSRGASAQEIFLTPTPGCQRCPCTTGTSAGQGQRPPSPPALPTARPCCTDQRPLGVHTSREMSSVTATTPGKPHEMWTTESSQEDNTGAFWPLNVQICLITPSSMVYRLFTVTSVCY